MSYIISDGKVMMEYIGATGKPITFDDVPIDDGIDFHFILSFAIDADPSGNPQNGKFSPYWASTLTPESVASIKSKHPNVKALASLSGWSLGQKTLNWYKPANTQQWISNAFTSLKSIVNTYHLDGIDIDYERFPKHNETFAYCIGELINKVTTPRGYLKAFVLRSEQFDKEKVIPSYEVDGRGIQGDAFFDALRLLESNGFHVNGAMIFSADASAEDNYYYERKTQAFLLNSTSHY
ncbi:hypothetical protein RND71_009264 [Anisodus tanguticus]|uniref:GH18 domain-containing protein n=1 Tax=Anisodus tanguticus TaxID=243964 RepID=A0AAE1VQZ0_9SOLA|nr:hypothetical protein RND71_009264 [Anisodus tanguticus]